MRQVSIWTNDGLLWNAIYKYLYVHIYIYIYMGQLASMGYYHELILIYIFFKLNISDEIKNGLSNTLNVLNYAVLFRRWTNVVYLIYTDTMSSDIFLP